MSASSIPSYPAELLLNGREPDQAFEPDELLFYRAERIDAEGKIGSIDVRAPNTSFNRGKYCKPVHVLCARLPQFLTWYVLEIRVDQIPSELQHPDGRKFQFRPVHDPVGPPDEPEENYSHTEIRAFLEKNRRDSLPRQIEKQIRQILADRMEPVAANRLTP